MKKEIIVNRSDEETRVAILENGILVDLFTERKESEKTVGNIYKGKVVNVLPGISSGFIDIGLDKNAYINADDVVGVEDRKTIDKVLHKGKEVIVQIEKEPISTKGSRITTDISLPGRLLVYMPFSGHIGISKNIEVRHERDRLKKIISEIKPETGGIIVRTEAEEATEKELKREIKYLTRLWGSISSSAKNAKPPALLHKDLGIVFQSVRDYFTEDVDILLIDSEDEYREAKNFIRIVSPELENKVQKYTANTPIFKAFNLEEEIKKLRLNRVNLPSGGYIIIQEAESLCAIDVNTGRFTGKKSQEETVTITNVEAAKEIARQLRIRNIGGIIVIDFIDMKRSKNRQKVLDVLNHSARGDKAKIKIWPITRLGLIEMTRERRRESFSSLYGEQCPMCNGAGLVVSKESLFIHVSNELDNMRLGRHHGKIKLKLNNGVANYFRERIARLKNNFGDKIEITGSRDIDWEDYRIIID